jgi:phosphohistidine phosphatase SixA
MHLLAAIAALLLSFYSPSTPAQIILIRHGEEPADPANPHLSPAGRERAAKLVAFLTSDPAMTKFGSPVAIFATATTKDDNGQRTQETVAPLAKALKLKVQTRFHGKDYAELAKLILANPAYSGKTVVICWNHEEIPQLAAMLGVNPAPPKWKGSVYDRVYLITYRDGKATLTEVPERLGGK